MRKGKVIAIKKIKVWHPEFGVIECDPNDVVPNYDAKRLEWKSGEDKK